MAHAAGRRARVKGGIRSALCKFRAGMDGLVHPCRLIAAIRIHEGIFQVSTGLSHLDHPHSAARSVFDWGVFAVLTVTWALAYALTRIAVDKGNPEMGLPVEWVLPGRLTTGAIVLWILMIFQGKSLPPFSDVRCWIAIFAMALVASVVPFFLITTAQQTVNSSLAALYTSAGPIFVAIAAATFFRDEHFTRNMVIGVTLGFAGVAILFGPDALRDWGSASVIAQLLLIGATFCYAMSNIVARGAPKMDSLAFATGFISVAAVLSWPLALTVDPATVNVNWTHWAAVAGLGLGPSGFAQALYMLLIARTSATFVSLVGYTIPIVSAGLGWILFGETQSWNALLAFGLILSGVWLARRGGGLKT